MKRFYGFFDHPGPSLLMLVFLTVLLYGGTLGYSWHFDDFHSIVNNPRLQMERLTPESVAAAMTAEPAMGRYDSNRLFRPVVNLTFALNRLVGGPDVFGFHVVNIAVHAAASVVLYLLILALYEAPGLCHTLTGERRAAAFFAAALWAANPVNVQAVTYIVQRMASLCALFYLAALLCWVRARTGSAQKRFRRFALSGVCFLLALGSKENAAVLPLSILLVEAAFFRNPFSGKKGKAFLLICIAACGGVAGWLVLSGTMAKLLGPYAYKSFTPGERLFAMPGVILFYLSLLVLPLPSRLTIHHDFTPDTLWIRPEVSALAAILLAACTVAAVGSLKKRPVLSFSFLFFMANHLVESSILPLELVFEHRNCLPAAFLFWPLAGVFAGAVRMSRRNSVIAVLPLALIMAFGAGTLVRNRAWRNEATLWRDAAMKAPQAARPVQNLARVMNLAGNPDKALELYRASLSLHDPKETQTRALALKNMGTILYGRGDLKGAVSCFRSALDLFPAYHSARRDLAVALAGTGDLAAAGKVADDLVRRPGDAGAYILKGAILLRQRQPGAALSPLKSALARSPMDPSALRYLGAAFTMKGDFTRARWFLRRAREQAPGAPVVHFLMLDNLVRSGEREQARRYYRRLVSGRDEKQVWAAFAQIQGDALEPPLSPDLRGVLGADGS